MKRFGFSILGLSSKYTDLLLTSGKMVLKDSNRVINSRSETATFHMWDCLSLSDTINSKWKEGNLTTIMCFLELSMLSCIKNHGGAT